MNWLNRATASYVGWAASNFPLQLHQSADWPLHVLHMVPHSGQVCVPICVCVRELCICLRLPFCIYCEGDGLCDGQILLNLGKSEWCSHSLTSGWQDIYNYINVGGKWAWNAYIPYNNHGIRKMVLKWWICTRFGDGIGMIYLQWRCANLLGVFKWMTCVLKLLFCDLRVHIWLNVTVHIWFIVFAVFICVFSEFQRYWNVVECFNMMYVTNYNVHIKWDAKMTDLAWFISMFISWSVNVIAMIRNHVGMKLSSCSDIFCYWCGYWMGRYGLIMNGCEIPCTV